MIVDGKVLSISAPNLWGMITGFRKWTLTFKCGNCSVDSTVQHDEIKKHHKCPVCKSINKFKKTSWYDYVYT